MDDLTKDVNNPAGAESGLNAELERMIDGDVTCWGIDDVIEYGIKVSAMEREACAKVCESLCENAERESGAEAAGWLDKAAELMRSNAEFSGRTEK